MIQVSYVYTIPFIGYCTVQLSCQKECTTSAVSELRSQTSHLLHVCPDHIWLLHHDVSCLKSGSACSTFLGLGTAFSCSRIPVWSYCNKTCILTEVVIPMEMNMNSTPNFPYCFGFISLLFLFSLQLVVLLSFLIPPPSARSTFAFKNARSTQSNLFVISRSSLQTEFKLLASSWRCHTRDGTSQHSAPYLDFALQI